MAHRVTLIRGDGVGPEVIGAAVRVVEATDVALGRPSVLLEDMSKA